MAKDQARIARMVATSAGIAWIVVLHLSGVAVAEPMRRLLGYIPSLAVLLIVAFDLWLWKWPGIAQLAGRPRLDGTWRTTLQPNSLSLIPEGGNRGPIKSAIVMEQTFWTVSIRLLTEESFSTSEIATLRSDGDSRRQELLTYTYRNEPKQVNRPRSSPHRGACELRVIGRVPMTLSGTYWTDRFTGGDLELELIDRRTDRASMADVPSS